MIRDYDNTPRPDIELHPHIRMLFEAQDKRAEDRTYHRDKEKLKAEREDLIKDAHHITLTDFFCETCQEDFKDFAYKQIEVDWSNTSQRIAFYRTRCDEGHYCLRYITDKHKDPFFNQSKELAYQRAFHAADVLQPHETGFNLLYARKNRQND